MAKCLVGSAGGLSAEDRAKLIPDNIREGVTLFEGTSKEVVGILPTEEYIGAYVFGNADRAASMSTSSGSNEFLTFTPRPGSTISYFEVVKSFRGRAEKIPTNISGMNITPALPDGQAEFQAGTKYTVNSSDRTAVAAVLFFKEV